MPFCIESRNVDSNRWVEINLAHSECTKSSASFSEDAFAKEIAKPKKKVFKNQIFFVANGRFTREEIEAYDLLSSIIFDKEVINYTTIVRVNFSDFEDYEKCANDRASLRMENAGLAYILNKVNIVYVDNPPLVGRAREINKEVREVPRKRLLTYLGTCQNTYRLSNLDTLNERIRKYANNQTPKGQKVANIHQTIANLQEQINELGLEASRIN
ncbi:hypothetical protein RhiirA5_370613 [Rhizophagus irregularis]|uniref:AIG1-type G domain-containing protein n=1 Tax=Rhizophagus irregularis TaxID=588596 RepID=A0A2N0Q923_9GLOM|nr:hypothetical protein RhiirA5_370613 [Rhizophagus irregularis]